MKYLFLLVCLLGFGTMQAQKNELEKSYEFENRSKKRTLAWANYDEQAKKYSMVYVTPAKKENFMFESYEFDEDFNLVNKSNEEIGLKAAEEKFKFVKDEEEAGGQATVLTVENNFGSQLVIKKGFITRTYSTAERYAGGGGTWSTTYASTKFNETDKVKPKSLEGRKVSLIAFQTDQPQLNVTTGTGYGFASSFQRQRKFSEATGDVLVVGMINPDLFTKEEKEPTNKFFTIMNFSAQTLEMKKETKFNFEHPKVLVYHEQLPDGDLALVFAAQGYANLPKKKDPDGLSYSFVRITKDGDIRERIDFKSLSAKWAVSGMSLQRNGDLYVYGPAAEEKDSYYDKMAGKQKYEQFLMMKLSGGKIAYYAATGKDDFEKLLKKSQAQKRASSYECKPFTEDEVVELPNGETLLKGQITWNDGSGMRYYDLLLFHFDKDGKLRAQYASNTEFKDGTPINAASPQYFIPSKDGKEVSWLILEMRDMTTEGKPLRGAKAGIININDATVAGLEDAGKKDHYLDTAFPFFISSDGARITTISGDNAGRSVVLGRIGLANSK
jgi:hypothetical protein